MSGRAGQAAREAARGRAAFRELPGEEGPARTGRPGAPLVGQRSGSSGVR